MITKGKAKAIRVEKSLKDGGRDGIIQIAKGLSKTLFSLYMVSWPSNFPPGPTPNVIIDSSLTLQDF